MTDRHALLVHVLQGNRGVPDYGPRSIVYYATHSCRRGLRPTGETQEEDKLCSRYCPAVTGIVEAIVTGIQSVGNPEAVFHLKSSTRVRSDFKGVLRKQRIFHLRQDASAVLFLSFPVTRFSIHDTR